MEGFKIQSTKNELNPDLFNFLDHVLPFTYNSDIFRWEYGHEDKVFCYIEDANEKVVGAQGMIPILVNTGNNIALSAKSETSYLGESTRGKGLFRQLYSAVIEESKENGIEFIWGFTALGPVWKKLGFHVKNECLVNCSVQVRPLTFTAKTLKPRAFLGFIKSWALSNKTKRVNRRSKSRLKESPEHWHIQDKPFNSNDIRSLHDQIRSNNPKLISLDMNESFIAYRIEENPFVDYETRYVYNEDRQLLGYYYLSINMERGIVFISDLTALNTDVKEYLISEAVSKAISTKGIRTLRMFGNVLNPLIAESFQILERHGARSYDSEMYIVLLPLKGESQESLQQFNNWYINGLWTEGISQ